MFQLMNMDRLLRLKMDLLYKGVPIEQARLRFEEIKTTPAKETEIPKVEKRRKLRIRVTEDK